MQKCAHLVEFEKCCQTHIYLHSFFLIQPRTSPPKVCKILQNFAKIANFRVRPCSGTSSRFAEAVGISTKPQENWKTTTIELQPFMCLNGVPFWNTTNGILIARQSMLVHLQELILFPFYYPMTPIKYAKNTSKESLIAFSWPSTALLKTGRCISTAYEFVAPLRRQNGDNGLQQPSI